MSEYYKYIPWYYPVHALKHSHPFYQTNWMKNKTNIFLFFFGNFLFPFFHTFQFIVYTSTVVIFYKHLFNFEYSIFILYLSFLILCMPSFNLYHAIFGCVCVFSFIYDYYDYYYNITCPINYSLRIFGKQYYFIFIM